MDSRPPTPSPSLPTSSSQWRFHNLSCPTEWLETYRPGRLHPVHIGDTFKEYRYKILRKLGYGSFSTVWLAKDQDTRRYIALKIMTANPALAENELTIHKHLSANKLDHPGSKNIISLLDYFEHTGPNGVHACLAFNVMGPSAATMVEELPQFQPRMYGMDVRYPTWMAKTLLRQTLLGLDFLHQNGIGHGDLQPGNILLPLIDLLSVEEKQLVQDQGNSTEPVRRLDGKTDPWAPRYLALNQPLTPFVNLSPGLVTKISDMGAAFFISNPPKNPVTPTALRSPELIVSGSITESQDIWSLGCLIFEFLTGRSLFCVDSSKDEDTDDDHLLQLYEILGSLPSSIRSQWPRAGTYFDPVGKNIKNYIGEDPPDDDTTYKSLAEAFDERKPSDMSYQEAAQVKELLSRILKYDIKERPTASELINDPWFSHAI